MVKKIIALLMVALMFLCVTPAIAATDSLLSLDASDYLDSCYIVTTPEGNRKITIDYVVNGTDEMLLIGATKVEIERYDDYEEDWVFDRTLTGGYTPNDVNHAGTTHFYGTRGEQYRAVIYGYAKNSRGSDSKPYTGSGVYCQ